MVEVESVIRKWGNSLGVIIPKEIVDEEKLFENEEVIVSIRKTRKIKELFGILKSWNQSAQELKNEARKGWDE